MAGAEYTVKNVEMIAETAGLRARLYTLAPDNVIPWHYHSTLRTGISASTASFASRRRCLASRRGSHPAIALRFLLKPHIAFLKARFRRLGLLSMEKLAGA